MKLRVGRAASEQPQSSLARSMMRSRARERARDELKASCRVALLCNGASPRQFPRRPMSLMSSGQKSACPKHARRPPLLGHESAPDLRWRRCPRLGGRDRFDGWAIYFLFLSLFSLPFSLFPSSSKLHPLGPRPRLALPEEVAANWSSPSIALQFRAHLASQCGRSEQGQQIAIDEPENSIPTEP